jgi:putative ABC transport system substrate-binding protein
MRRREFITILGGAATTWPSRLLAQQPNKLPTIGFLGAGTPSGWSSWVTAFQRRLRELGWIDGSTVHIEYRWAEGQDERETQNAAEFVRLKVDVIVTVGGHAAKQATSTIPIVFAISADPLGTGLVTSLARPGGNLTGFSIQSTDLAGKRLELLREILPGLRQLAIMTNLNYRAAVLEANEVQAAARRLGISVVTSDIRSADDIAPGVEALKGRAEALYVPANPLANANRIRINTLALGARLPTMFGFREYVETGGLISYGPNTSDLFRRSADLVDKILRGTKPANIPVEQPTRFDLVINLTTAKALGVTIPEAFLLRADEMIE